jgi:hypothetical protein
MKIRSLIEKVIGPVLLLIPMTCMHLGDGHHDGDHHSSIHQPSYQYQEGTQTQPEGEKGG